ncbi:MAG: acyl-CoA/acyl-ACP dehydrogenase [Gammaproteobacteria bacterium]|nr:acyl-CoA/acyl-ACP dehydrogenase [Gammaproteobacteria bacterium]
MSRLHPSEERAALEESVRRWCEDRATVAAEPRFVAERWREIAGFGWLAAVLEESAGGLGLSPSHASVIAEALAPAASQEPFAAQLALGGWVLARARGGVARDALLETWLAGESLVALADGDPAAPPWTSRPAFWGRRVGGDLLLDGEAPLALDGMLASHCLLVVADEREAKALYVLPAAALERVAREALDGRAHASIRCAGLAAPDDARLEFEAGTDAVLAEAAWLHALCAAAESVGLLRAMLRASVVYLGQREQFGRALIEFQVLQHRLVDMTLTLTRLESLLEVARFKVDELGLLAASPWIAAAKAATGEEGRAVARAAVQLHGAIGLTAELALGRQLRRLTALELLAGTTAQHEAHWRATRTA